MFRKVKQFYQLPGIEKQIFLSAWYRLWQVRISLWTRSYKQTRALIEGRTSVPISSPGQSVPADRMVYLVGAASRFVLSGTCLTQAIVGEWMLKEAGFSPSLNIGVRKGADEDFGAHAWLEINGQELVSNSSSKFKSIYQD